MRGRERGGGDHLHRTEPSTGGTFQTFAHHSYAALYLRRSGCGSSRQLARCSLKESGKTLRSSGAETVLEQNGVDASAYGRGNFPASIRPPISEVLLLNSNILSSCWTSRLFIVSHKGLDFDLQPNRRSCFPSLPNGRPTIVFFPPDSPRLPWNITKKRGGGGGLKLLSREGSNSRREINIATTSHSPIYVKTKPIRKWSRMTGLRGGSEGNRFQAFQWLVKSRAKREDSFLFFFLKKKGGRRRQAVAAKISASNEQVTTTRPISLTWTAVTCHARQCFPKRISFTSPSAKETEHQKKNL